jgi:hypothetical protein
MAKSKSKGEAFNRRVLLRMLRRARDKSRPLVPSRTLRRSMNVFVYRNNSELGVLEIPYYWALHVHDGRGSFGVHSRARSGGGRQPKHLLWFRKPRNDPRTQGGTNYPRREKDVVQMWASQAEYQNGLKRNRERYKQGKEPYMVVRKFNTKEMAPSPFFSRGLAGFDEEVGDIVLEEWERLVRSELIGDESTASFRL